MNTADGSPQFFYLPGAGGVREGDLTAFASGFHPALNFETIGYPGWRRYVEEGFSAETLIAELTAEVVKKAPSGPISLIGLSLGGHFAYAVALGLQAMDREVDLLCAIDSFMVTSSAPREGWQVRAISECLDVLKRRRLNEVGAWVQSKAWRALLRLTGDQLMSRLRKASRRGRPPAIFSNESMAERELSLRLLLRAVVPWLADLDRNPLPLKAPTILLRTQPNAYYDEAWRHRCPDIIIREVPGKHRTLLTPENLDSLRGAYTTAADELAASAISR